MTTSADPRSSQWLGHIATWALTPSIKLRKAMRCVPLERKRKMFRLFLVHRCVTGRAPQCLSENLKINEKMGHGRTRGLNNLFMPQTNSDFLYFLPILETVIL